MRANGEQSSVKKSLIIFDMDGVLIDVSGSYREVVRRTVVHYLQWVIGAAQLSNGFISLSDIDRIKKNGDLNNDWDLSYAIVNSILFHYFDPHNSSLAQEFSSLNALGNDKRIEEGVCRVRKGFNSQKLLTELGNRPVSKLYFEWKTTSKTVSPFLINHGDVRTGNLIKRIFQELYLGKRLFVDIYNEQPLFYKGSGFIDREVLIPSISDLQTLTESNMLSIATGRPEVEAWHAIEHFGLSGFFESVVTEDDIVAAEKKEKVSLRKPHPYTIRLCIERCGFEKDGFIYYVGDMPDDMVASRRAGVIPIGFVTGGRSPAGTEPNEHGSLLMQKGAKKVFFNFDDLIAFFG
jgi:HAD superfamily hydrolase (TIGR01548 family)